MKPVEDKVTADVSAYGWHVVLVAASDTAPDIAYTVGLSASFDHPEVAVLGLPSPKAHMLLNEVGAAVRGGSKFGPDDRVTDLIVGLEVAFRPFPKEQYFQYLGLARKFYRDDGFDAIQLVWPDAQGRFPWDSGVAEDARLNQVVAS